MSWTYGLALTVLAMGCGSADPDGDGLTNSEEKEYQTNPKVADTDEDGLSDGDEIYVYGTNPIVADSDQDGLVDGDEVNIWGTGPNTVDSDGDGFADNEEVLAGCNPVDIESIVYAGGWPCNPNIDSMVSPDNSSASVDEIFNNYTMVDQFGDQVRLYDFANQDDVKIVIDVSAEWCPPCQAIAEWLDDGPIAPEYDSFWPGVREAVEDGELIWITILGENMNGNPAVEDTCVSWYDEFPHPLIPVLADTEAEVVDYVNLAAWPTVLLLNADMTVDTKADYWDILDALSAEFSE
jgi:thiol-disulfide isomerase/thioredoxin